MIRDREIFLSFRYVYVLPARSALQRATRRNIITLTGKHINRLFQCVNALSEHVLDIRHFRVSRGLPFIAFRDTIYYTHL